MNCSNCGNDISQTANSCPYCGTANQLATTAELKNEAQNEFENESSGWIPFNCECLREDITPFTFMGKEDAVEEWSSENKPVNLFLHTESYESFKRDDVYFLFGRRGTGKTCIMKMFQYEVRNNQNRDFSYCWLDNNEDSFKDLAIYLRASEFKSFPQDELVHFLTQKWDWILKISAMLAVIYPNRDNPKKDKNLSIVLRYLISQDLITDKADDNFKFAGSPVKKLADIVIPELEKVHYTPIQLATAITQIAKKLLSPDFNEALAALSSFLADSKTRCVVMIDSIENYNLRDNISRAVTSALINATMSLHIQSQKRIIAKVAFPAEIYPHLSSTNQEKTERGNVFIHWTYRSLVCLLAKRYRSFVFGDKAGRNYEELDRFNNARDFIYQYLPETVKNRSGINFDTISYIIKHTQKKPRQVILIMNIILTLANHQKNKNGTFTGPGILDNVKKIFKLTEQDIVNGVHARLDILVKGCLDIYEQIYDNAERIVLQSLFECKNHFGSNYLDQLIKESSSLRKDSNLSRDDVRRLLLESGVIGLRGESHELKNTSMKLWEVMFEYQIKGTLSITQRTYCVIHPMFYKTLQCKVDRNIVVYPIPQEDEEVEQLKAMGINLR
jgi:Cdc6-like AAA superfamily ATPase